MYFVVSIKRTGRADFFYKYRGSKKMPSTIYIIEVLKFMRFAQHKRWLNLRRYFQYSLIFKNVSVTFYILQFYNDKKWTNAANSKSDKSLGMYVFFVIFGNLDKGT